MQKCNSKRCSGAQGFKSQAILSYQPIYIESRQLSNRLTCINKVAILSPVTDNFATRINSRERMWLLKIVHGKYMVGPKI